MSVMTTSVSRLNITKEAVGNKVSEWFKKKNKEIKEKKEKEE